MSYLHLTPDDFKFQQRMKPSHFKYIGTQGRSKPRIADEAELASASFPARDPMEKSSGITMQSAR
jgi:hypothetical protein